MPDYDQILDMRREAFENELQEANERVKADWREADEEEDERDSED